MIPTTHFIFGGTVLVLLTIILGVRRTTINYFVAFIIGGNFATIPYYFGIEGWWSNIFLFYGILNTEGMNYFIINLFVVLLSIGILILVLSLTMIRQEKILTQADIRMIKERLKK